MPRIAALAFSITMIVFAGESVGQSYDNEKFERFKKALMEGNDLGALGIMRLAPDPDEARMKQYAEAECAKKNSTACSLLYCGANAIIEEYYSRSALK